LSVIPSSSPSEFAASRERDAACAASLSSMHIDIKAARKVRFQIVMGADDEERDQEIREIRFDSIRFDSTFVVIKFALLDE